MSNSPDLNEDFADMIRCLQDAGAEFLIVGAHALAAHGIPRATGDIDLFVKPSSDNAVRIIEALRAFGAPLDAHGVDATDFAVPGSIYQIGLPPRRIDLITEISGVSFDEAWSSRIESTVHGMSLAFIGRDALLKNKLASGRDKDLLDAKKLAP